MAQFSIHSMGIILTADDSLEHVVHSLFCQRLRSCCLTFNFVVARHLLLCISVITDGPFWSTSIIPPKAKGKLAVSQHAPKAKAVAKQQARADSVMAKSTCCGSEQGGVKRQRSKGGYFISLQSEDPIIKGQMDDMVDLTELLLSPDHLPYCRNYFNLIKSGRALTLGGKDRRSSRGAVNWNKNRN